jgi:hypothetical protein
VVGEPASLFAGAGMTVGAAWPLSRFRFVDARGATAFFVLVVLAAFVAWARRVGFTPPEACAECCWTLACGVRAG